MEDFYRVKNGRGLGVGMVPAARMDVYKKLEIINMIVADGTLNGQFTAFLRISGRLCSGLISGDFLIDLRDLGIKKSD